MVRLVPWVAENKSSFTSFVFSSGTIQMLTRIRTVFVNIKCCCAGGTGAYDLYVFIKQAPKDMKTILYSTIFNILLQLMLHWS